MATIAGPSLSANFCFEIHIPREPIMVALEAIRASLILAASSAILVSAYAGDVSSEGKTMGGRSLHQRYMDDAYEEEPIPGNTPRETRVPVQMRAFPMNMNSPRRSADKAEINGASDPVKFRFHSEADEPWSDRRHPVRPK